MTTAAQVQALEEATREALEQFVRWQAESDDGGVYVAPLDAQRLAKAITAALQSPGTSSVTREQLAIVAGIRDDYVVLARDEADFECRERLDAKTEALTAVIIAAEPSGPVETPPTECDACENITTEPVIWTLCHQCRIAYATAIARDTAPPQAEPHRLLTVDELLELTDPATRWSLYQRDPVVAQAEPPAGSVLCTQGAGYCTHPQCRPLRDSETLDDGV